MIIGNILTVGVNQLKTTMRADGEYGLPCEYGPKFWPTSHDKKKILPCVIYLIYIRQSSRAPGLYPPAQKTSLGKMAKQCLLLVHNFSSIRVRWSIVLQPSV